MKKGAEKAGTPSPAQTTASRVPRILFVCYGNICRSPMAAGIAAKRLGPGAEVASAGIAATPGVPVAYEAVLVMRIVYKTDIKGHTAKNILDVDLKSFDYVVAMDLTIFNRLKSLGAVPEEKLYAWNIEDPLGHDYDTFKSAAREIERRLDKFLVTVGLDY
jgi:protein-tyrosine phosphatase